MIEFFANKLANTAPLATFATRERMTIEGWIQQQTTEYQRSDVQPISVAINDELICPTLWHKVKFKPSDHVQFWHEPKGLETIGYGLMILAAAVVVSKIMAPKMPGMPSNSGMVQGNPLDEASAKGNKVKLGDPIRSLAGLQKLYPSYLAEPRTFFADPREQWVEMLLYITAGSVWVEPSDISVGETPIISLGADANYTIFPPGADVTGHTASMLWYNVPEVGSSSSGSAGLDLTIANPLTPSSSASAYQFNGVTIAIPSGAGSFPADWSTGLIVRVLSPYLYNVVDGGAGRDIVRGPLEMLAPYPGQLIEISGDNAGLYVVNSYTPYAAAIPPTAGTASTILGSSVPARYDYDVTPLTFTVTLGTTPYSVALSVATTDLAGLVSAVNTAKGSAPFLASASSGRLLITEIGAFSGLTLVSSGGSDVLGSSPTNTIGTAADPGTPEQLAEMTINYDGGSPVSGLAIGASFSTIGPRGLRYRITAFSADLMVVDRLTSSGAVDASWPGFVFNETVSGMVILDPSNLEGGYRGPFACSPKGELVTHIEYTVFAQNGIIGLGRKGDTYTVPTGHDFEYRDMDVAGAWTVLPQALSGNTRDSLGFTFRHALPYPMRPEARIKRHSKVGGENSSEVNDDMSWYGLRGLRQNRPSSYPGMTTIALQIRGGDRLSAQSESQVNLIGCRVLPVYTGGAWTAPTPTRGIAPWCLNVLKSLGYTDADIDLPEWDRLHTVFEAAGQYYDEVIDDTSTAKDRINDALACGYAELTIKNGLVSLVRDEPRAAFDITYGPKTQTYSPQNMTKPLKIDGPLPSINDFDGVDVEYYSNLTWAWETVPCRWPGDAGLKVEKIKLSGVGDRDRAYRFGMRRRGHQLFRQDTYSWETELAGMNSGYLSFCAVASDTPGLCQSAQLRSVTAVDGGFLLESTEPIDWSAPEAYRVGISRPDGSLSGPFPVTAIDEYHLQIVDLDFEPDTSMTLELPQLLIGPASKWAYPVLVNSSSPSNGNVALKGMPYDDRVYTYDSATAP
ncbi:host specificity factor TipJ family phage tail protein [Pseudomonas sp. BF-R-19]|uniref:host specificity factor TipJ family phage tail protein n=1 Tax=Pseudomonas sp. BF-R-19 TaxID=2832397 RepID=UPI001CBB5775|nr:host specificity factor TipJ family phage tail protein [Pseudomonas sp. BF-R-19]